MAEKLIQLQSKKLELLQRLQKVIEQRKMIDIMLGQIESNAEMPVFDLFSKEK